MMDGPHSPPAQHRDEQAETPALQQVAQNVRGTAELLSYIAQAPSTPGNLRAGLALLVRTLDEVANQADQLIDDVGIDISSHLGITTTDLANMRFAPVTPGFRRQPATLTAWKQSAEADFNLWGKVEQILAEDDVGLEHRFIANPEEHLTLVDAMEKLRERFQGDTKLIEATLLRLAVAVARWEQSGQG